MNYLPTVCMLLMYSSYCLIPLKVSDDEEDENSSNPNSQDFPLKCSPDSVLLVPATSNTSSTKIKSGTYLVRGRSLEWIVLNWNLLSMDTNYKQLNARRFLAAKFRFDESLPVV